MGIGFGRMNQPGYVMRIVPGPNPAETALTEVLCAAGRRMESRGIDVDLNGVVWTPLGERSHGELRTGGNAKGV